MKPDCRKISALLKSDYLDNELDPVARKQVEQHLANCPACRSRWENIQEISRALRRAPRQNPPESLWPRIQAEIAGHNAPPLGRPAGGLGIKIPRLIFAPKRALALAAAAMLVLAAIGFYLESRRPPPLALAPTLTNLLGNDIVREPNLDFGSSIEQYLL